MIILLGATLWANNPISGYDRAVTINKSVIYSQIDGNFSFTAKKIIDSDNIYNQGSVDNYDDPYIKAIVKDQTPYKSIKGSSDRTIHILFGSAANRDNFIKEFSLDIFKKEKLNIELYMLDAKKINLPLNLSVYPFFVMGSRYVQGVITPKLLKGLIEESDYSPKPKLPIQKLKAKIKEKYNMDEKRVDVKYNEGIELYEVYKKDEKRVNSYISKDGRYIIVF